MGERMRTVLGLDAGWSNRFRTSSLCLLSWGEGKVVWRFEDVGSERVARLQTLQRVTQGHSIECVAIDGPLDPSLNLVNRYRSAEALLSRGLFQKRGKPTQLSSGGGQKLHVEATWWARHIAESVDLKPGVVAGSIGNLPIVESLPSAALAVLVPDADFPVRPRRAVQWTDHLFATPVARRALDQVLVDLTGCTSLGLVGALRAHDRVTALACAFTALCVAARDYVAVGDSSLGHIVLPPARYWGLSDDGVGAWAWKQLELNASTVARDPRFDGLNPGLKQVVPDTSTTRNSAIIHRRVATASQVRRPASSGTVPAKRTRRWMFSGRG